MPRTLAVALVLLSFGVGAAERPSPTNVTMAPGEGLTAATEDGRTSLTIRSRAVLRTSVGAADDTLTSETQVRTLRLFLLGNVLSPQTTYLIQLAFGGNDFEAGSASPVFDAWVEHAFTKELRLRAGQYFVPFDRARTLRESTLQFVDRPQIVGELTLDRDVGLMLWAPELLAAKFLGYHLGVFGGDGRNRFGGTTPAGGLLYVARLKFQPFGAFDDDSEGDLLRRPEPRLAVAVAGAFNVGTHRARSTTGDTMASAFDYSQLAVDFVLKWRGVSVLAEFVSRTANTRFRDVQTSGGAVREWSRQGWGALVQAGVMVSDEVELSGRWDRLATLGGETDPTLEAAVRARGNELAIASTWYLNGHKFKLQADYSYQYGIDFAKGRQLARVQLDASF
jgi:hypothetical protein